MNLQLTINGATIIPTDKQAKAIQKIIFGGGTETETITYTRIGKHGKRRRILGARPWTEEDRTKVYELYNQYKDSKKDSQIARLLAPQINRTPSAINNVINIYKKTAH